MGGKSILCFRLTSTLQYDFCVLKGCPLVDIKQQNASNSLSGGQYPLCRSSAEAQQKHHIKKTNNCFQLLLLRHSSVGLQWKMTSRHIVKHFPWTQKHTHTNTYTVFIIYRMEQWWGDISKSVRPSFPHWISFNDRGNLVQWRICYWSQNRPHLSRDMEFIAVSSLVHKNKDLSIPSDWFLCFHAEFHFLQLPLTQ